MAAAEGIAALSQDGLAVRPLQEIHRGAQAGGLSAPADLPVARSAAAEPR